MSLEAVSTSLWTAYSVSSRMSCEAWAEDLERLGLARLVMILY